jgi:glycosyltransferase involved in cell wall biosynthesis
MRIAQVSPLYESVPPQLYGGTERVVSHLTEALVEAGHDVTLFASADSVTSARLVPCCPQALRLSKDSVDSLPHHLVQVEAVMRQAAHFDVIHWHGHLLHFPLARRTAVPQVTTLHGRLDLPDLVPLFAEYAELPVVSISDAQRAPLPRLRWVGTVHHGLPTTLFQFQAGPGRYLAFLGRISPEKGVDRAIRIAQRVGMPLKIAAKIDVVDRPYFHAMIEPLLHDPLIEYVGEIGEPEKNEFLGDAAALLFPIDWPEPFGLVMLEAMACGTPIIAYRNGSVPEVMVDQETGVICDTEEDALRALAGIAGLPRWRCRAVFEARYTARRMADAYVRIYRDLVRNRCGTGGLSG